MLILRFSSFGDVLQSLCLPAALKTLFPQVEVHFVTKAIYADVVALCPSVHRVWPLQKGQSVVSLTGALSNQSFDFILDAHNNPRSHLLAFFYRLLNCSSTRTIRRPRRDFRRWLLVRFHLNLLEQPFFGQRDFLRMLRPLGFSGWLPQTGPAISTPTSSRLTGILRFDSFVCLAPSAAFELKRWPIESWSEVIRQLPKEKFVVLGGPQDSFLSKLLDVAPERVQVLAGRLSFVESLAAVSLSKLLITNDTGLLHAGEQLNHPTLALMGPAPFGFPGRTTTHILETDLPCRPCSKHGQGPCVFQEYQACLRRIFPSRVVDEAQAFL